jgi:hypothetical protein
VSPISAHTYMYVGVAITFCSLLVSVSFIRKYHFVDPFVLRLCLYCLFRKVIKSHNIKVTETSKNVEV